MKFICLIICFLFSFNAFAITNWMSKGDILKANQKQHGGRVFLDQGKCQQVQGEKCFSYEQYRNMVQVFKKNLRFYKVNSNYEAKSKVLACSGSEDCSAKIQPVCANEICEDYCDSVSEDHFVVVKEDYTEVYCTKIVSENLEFDQDLKDAHDAEVAAASQAEVDKLALLLSRKQQLKNAVLNWATLSEAQKGLVIKEMAKQLVFLLEQMDLGE